MSYLSGVHRYLAVLCVASALACARNDAPRPEANESASATAPRNTQPSTQQRPSIPPEYLTVAGCDPCTFRIAPDAPPFTFRFVMRSESGGSRTISAIVAGRPDRTTWSQSLAAQEMPTVAAGDSLFLGAEDIDFDGNNDVFLLTSRGVANAYAAYWVYRPAADTFAYVGNYPVFRRNTTLRRLSTYERGGDAGREYETRQYAFAGDTITLLEVETQEATGQDGAYRRTISRLEGGALRVVRVDTVRIPPGS